VQPPSGPDHAPSFRPVPRTGVIFVMTEAGKRGFAYGNSTWSNLGQGAPETGPLPEAAPRISTIAVAAASHEYSPVDGLVELKESVAALYNARYRKGMKSQYTAENVAISSGGRAALTRLASALGPIHLGHLLPDYTAYAELLDLFRAFVPIPIVLRPGDGFRLPPERLREAVVGMGLGAVLLSNPCNPTGNVVSGDELGRYLAIARKLACTFIFDEFYAHYVYGGQGPVSAARYVEDVDRDPVVLVDGLTKNWRYPGWRLAWTLGPRDVIRHLASAGSFLDGGAPHPIQRAAIPLLELATADREARAIQAVFRRKRDVMVDRVRQMGMRLEDPPGGAFYCFPSLEDLPEGLRDGMSFFEKALERQVITVPGAFFDIDPGKRRGHLPSRLTPYVRLSFGPELDQVAAGLDRLAAMIAEAR
jgi:aspartate/methionine/tyrosine aminotransferase